MHVDGVGPPVAPRLRRRDRHRARPDPGRAPRRRPRRPLHRPHPFHPGPGDRPPRLAPPELAAATDIHTIRDTATAESQGRPPPRLSSLTARRVPRCASGRRWRGPGATTRSDALYGRVRPGRKCCLPAVPNTTKSAARRTSSGNGEPAATHSAAECSCFPGPRLSRAHSDIGCIPSLPQRSASRAARAATGLSNRLGKQRAGIAGAIQGSVGRPRRCEIVEKKHIPRGTPTAPIRAMREPGGCRQGCRAAFSCRCRHHAPPTAAIVRAPQLITASADVRGSRRSTGSRS